MNFTQLEYFLTIAQTGSITAAARRLFISQQTLSESLRRLEDELGVTLVQRTRPIALTEAGQCVAEGARDILDRKAQMLQQLESAEEKYSLLIHISAKEAPPFLPKLIAAFQREHPEYTITLQSHEKMDSFASGILFSSPFADLDSHLAWYPVWKDTLAVVVQDELLKKTFGSNTACLRQQLSTSGDLAQLKPLPFVVLTSPPDVSNPILSALEKAHIDSGQIREVSNSALLHSLCEIGSAATIHPQSYASSHYAHQITDGVLELFPLDEQYGSYLLHIGCGRQCRPQSIERQFIRFTQEFMNREMPVK